jgi:pimeloyl-ACP methyl ester carboxylesterase
MMVYPLAFGFLLLLILAVAISISASFYLTRRHYLQERRSPAEFDLAYEEVSFLASDGLNLYGWWIPAPGSHRAVVILHGHGGSMDMDVHRAAPFHAAGFHVLLFDFRAHGRSEGNLITFGYLERRDVLGAVSFLKERGVKRIGLLGLSLGGIVAMTATPICPDVLAAVSDGGPVRMLTSLTVWGMEHRFPRWFAGALAWLAICGASLRLGANLFHYEPVRWVGKITPRPIFFVHGEQDQYLPDFDDLYAAANEPKQAWRVPAAGHTTVSQLIPEEYSHRVIAFFERWLNQP